MWGGGKQTSRACGRPWLAGTGEAGRMAFGCGGGVVTLEANAGRGWGQTARGERCGAGGKWPGCDVHEVESPGDEQAIDLERKS